MDEEKDIIIENDHPLEMRGWSFFHTNSLAEGLNFFVTTK